MNYSLILFALHSFLRQNKIWTFPTFILLSIFVAEIAFYFIWSDLQVYEPIFDDLAYFLDLAKLNFPHSFWSLRVLFISPLSYTESAVSFLNLTWILLMVVFLIFG